MVNTIIEERNQGYFGELFDIQFLNLSDLDKIEFNPFTSKAMERFQKYIGSKSLKASASPFIPK